MGAPTTEVRVRELGHIVLYVSDLSRSAEFYRDVLGWPAVSTPGAFPAVAFSTGRTHHELLLIEVGPGAAPIPAGRRVGMYHFGVKIGDSDDDLRAMVERLKGRPDLVRLVGTADHGFTHSLYVTDPDGNELELYIDVAGVDWNDLDAIMAAGTKPLVL